LAYQKANKKIGIHKTLFNAHATHGNSKNMNVKIAVLEQKEFNPAMIQKVIKLKSAGLLIILDNEDFVPSAQWNEAYEFLRISIQC
jgi:hypothetical protein